ncbi:MAG: hypothetical protein LW875_03665 [Proteobacteria bacterium]|jgi:hypothetical protein|nr:hypothetical protein [Pseudomonadota bacterium]
MKLSFFLVSFILAFRLAWATCPEDQRPVFQLTEGARSLLLCAYSEPVPEKNGQVRLEGYQLLLNDSVTKQVVESGPEETRFLAQLKGKEILIHELISTQSFEVPVFVRVWSCDKKECHLKGEKCVYKNSKKPSKKLTVKNMISKESKEQEIEHLAAWALAGDKKAQEAFLKDQKHIQMESSVEADFQNWKSLLQKMQKFKCL